MRRRTLATEVGELEKARKPEEESEGMQQHPARIRARLPGFVTHEEIGLGDVIKRASSAIGVKPCGGCDRRAAALNRWLTFSGRPFR